MKISRMFVVLGLLALSGCSGTKATEPKVATGDPETMLLTYFVIPGKEKELEAVLAKGWEIYRRENLVAPEPHILLKGTEGFNTRYVEIFTWVSHIAPDNAPADVKQTWAEEQALCEARNGHGGIEGGK